MLDAGTRIMELLAQFAMDVDLSTAIRLVGSCVHCRDLDEQSNWVKRVTVTEPPSS